MSNLLPILVLAGAAVVLGKKKKKKNGAGTTSGGPGGTVGGPNIKIVGGGRMKNPSTGKVAVWRVLREREGDLVWSQIKLPGEGWRDQLDKNAGEPVYFETQAKALKSAPLGVAFLGFTEKVGSVLYGQQAKSL